MAARSGRRKGPGARYRYFTRAAKLAVLLDELGFVLVAVEADAEPVVDEHLEDIRVHVIGGRWPAARVVVPHGKEQPFPVPRLGKAAGRGGEAIRVDRTLPVQRVVLVTATQSDDCDVVAGVIENIELLLGHETVTPLALVKSPIKLAECFEPGIVQPKISNLVKTEAVPYHLIIEPAMLSRRRGMPQWPVPSRSRRSPSPASCSPRRGSS